MPSDSCTTPSAQLPSNDSSWYAKLFSISGVCFLCNCQHTDDVCPPRKDRRFDLHWTALHIVIMIVQVSRSCKPHGYELNDEQCEHSHKGNAFNPWVLHYHTCEAFITQRLMCGSQQLWNLSICHYKVKMYRRNNVHV